MKKCIRETIFEMLREIRSANSDANLMFNHANLCGFISGAYCLEGMSYSENTRMHKINRATFQARSEELFKSRRAA